MPYIIIVMVLKPSWSPFTMTQEDDILPEPGTHFACVTVLCPPGLKLVKGSLCANS